MMRVAVLGGGLTGLACAYYAQRAGLTPVVFEATQGSGLLSQRFSAGDRELDSFHSPLSRHDLALCGLLAELGYLHRMVWREVETAVYRSGSVRPLQSADFPPLQGLSRWDRLRAEIASLVCSRWFQSEAELHKVTATAWLTRHYGARTYERIWSPLLRARYGESAEEVPAFIVWRFLRGVLTERRALVGHLMGGYGALCARLRAALIERGAEVRLGSPVRGVQIDGGEVSVSTDHGMETYKAAISTLPIPDLAKIASAQLLSSLPGSGLEQRGILSAVALLRRPLRLPYRVVDLDGSLGFEQVISASQLVPASAVGPFAPVYLVRHCPGHGEEYRASDAEVADAARRALLRMSPDLTREEVEDVRVFRAPYVEPVWRVGPRAPVQIDRSQLYLCTMLQAYPREAGSDASVVLARETVRRVAFQLGRS